MTEVWLQANRRLIIGPMWSALIFSGVCITGATLLGGVKSTDWKPQALMCAAIAVIVYCLLLMWLSQRPRLTFDGRALLMRIRNGSPIRVPIEVVEAFLIGKGPAYLTGKDDYKTEARTLIIRISERAPEFEKLETNLRLAAWCGHYVTIRGTFTEPLDVEVVNRLNQRLYDAQQSLKSSATSTAAATAGASQPS